MVDRAGGGVQGVGGLPPATPPVPCSRPQVLWRHVVTQAVCQALRGRKDFPVLGAGLVSGETPACRSVAYTFLAEGRLCQATYEGEWCRGRPHGR